MPGFMVVSLVSRFPARMLPCRAGCKRLTPSGPAIFPTYGQSSRPAAGAWPRSVRSAAVVRRPVGLAARRDGVVEHLVLLRHGGVTELGRAAAVFHPGRLAELVQPVVAARVRDLSVAAGLRGDDAGLERTGAAGV